MYTKAITLIPGSNYANGLTTVNLGKPDLQKTLEEHSNYLLALRGCGLSLIELPADLRFPDSTFVEDTAIIIPESSLSASSAILTRPGADSRAGEVQSMKQTLEVYFPDLPVITAPGTLDGGDVCEAGSHFFIGVSLRTNEVGAHQLGNWLVSKGYTYSLIDIRHTPDILHLKSGISYIGENRLVVIQSLAGHQEFQSFQPVLVRKGEEYAANCIRVNDYILLAAGFPYLESDLRKLGYKLKVLDMSEFQKMDGGLSCLSLRF